MTSMIDSVDSKYKKHELRSHIYNRPAMYIGTIEPNTIDTYIVDNSNKIIKKQITYIYIRNEKNDLLIYID